MAFLRFPLLLVSLIFVLPLGGCAGLRPQDFLKSRWAMDDPVYAEKYCEGAEQGDLVGKLKQASDARFQEGKQGLYASAGAQKRGEGSGMGGAELGFESYSFPWSTTRTSLSLFSAGAGDDTFFGLDLGTRLQVPARLAPFVGAGVYVGFAEEEVLADHDRIDNNEDGFIDEYGETRDRMSGAFASIYPELGTHFWINSSWRLTANSRYLVTTEGRDADGWLVGFGVAVFSH